MALVYQTISLVTTMSKIACVSSIFYIFMFFFYLVVFGFGATSWSWSLNMIVSMDSGTLCSLGPRDITGIFILLTAAAQSTPCQFLLIFSTTTCFCRREGGPKYFWFRQLGLVCKCRPGIFYALPFYLFFFHHRIQLVYCVIHYSIKNVYIWSNLQITGIGSRNWLMCNTFFFYLDRIYIVITIDI